MITFPFGPRGIGFGTIIDSTPPAEVVAVASPVYPRGSSADVQQRLGAAHGDASFRYITRNADGVERTSLLHRGNAVAVRSAR